MVPVPGAAVTQRPPQRADLQLEVALLDDRRRLGPGDQFLFADHLAGTPTRAARMSKARLPSRTGLSPSSSSRCIEKC
jgi:hypothetical protein